MALNTVSSDRLSTNVKTSNLGTELKKKVGQNKNIVINGAMQVAQRATTYTGADAYTTVDRFRLNHTGLNEDCTTAQADVASGTTPYSLGFRKAYKVTNGNQTAGAGAGDRIAIQYRLEAQDIANSGWNYVSSSSNITLQFWVKSSVAQNFFGTLKTSDGTAQAYVWETGALTADTWTKITKTIPGNSNLQFDNNNEQGLQIEFTLFRGTDQTGSVTLNQWAAFNSSTQTPDNTSTWYTTNDATFEITGVQLEVGSVATDFEHRSFGQELALCQRYYQRYREGNNKSLGLAFAFGTNEVDLPISFIVPMRATPSLEQNVATSGYVGIENDSIGGSQYVNNNFTLQFGSTNGCNLYADPSPTLTIGQAVHLTLRNAAAYLAFTAEL